RVVIDMDFTELYKCPLHSDIDDRGNTGDNADTTWPERMYIIDETGHIVERGGLGPFHYKPAEVRQWLAAKYGAVKQGAEAAAASASRASAPASTSSEGTTSLSVPAKSEK